ncbi:lycopene beta-cyclase CrtY [Erythrobacter sp. SCSIO 43205]|uniref:lycopene beta-cyclase CrtY n=1 Tax=Erythrobacter sp. SCSIO 43205 TaxID=2779361 RepID=UPI001CA7D9FF|nr:lycopene beta-cyclase CrtY [Erythrobacter sp. SCSIO 43205]UAB77792.1 lycopene beta-cyclase CrtY [Erythrobacter sp. SCSIO 43205]
MTDSQVDCVIVGGGLAGGLIALALQRARPEFRIRLIEAGRTIGGNHRWSWFDSDLDEAGHKLLEGFRQTEWDNGYEVRFPKYRRNLKTSYRSLASPDFHEGIVRELPEGSVILGRKAVSLDSRGVDLAASKYQPAERINARSVIDCRSFTPSKHLKGGWQVFLGRHMRLDKPHGVERPVIMDATVDQLAPHGNGSSYRFVYVLPLGVHDVFIEDTYYADDPLLDRSALSGRIDQYARANGWQDGLPVHHEAGVLPVLTGGDFAAYQDEVRIPGVAIAGARGGFTHPLTSYTMCVAVENALAIAEHADLSGEQLAAFFDARAKAHWKKTGYYRLLARFLFFAAKPEKRVKVFQRFYGLREGLIERFYAARSNAFDKVRVLWGEPPVAIHSAIAAMFKSGPALRSKKSDRGVSEAAQANELQKETQA